MNAYLAPAKRLPRAGDERSLFEPRLPCDRQARPPLRAGYMGHMTQIANKLHIAVETRQEVAEHVQDSNQWQNYFTTHLEPWNEVGFFASFCSVTQNLPHSLLLW